MLSAGFWGCTPTGLGNSHYDAEDIGEDKDAPSPAIQDAGSDAGGVKLDAWGFDAITDYFDSFFEEIAKPPKPNAPEAKYVADLPCAFPASLRYDAKGNRLFTTCASAENELLSTPMPENETQANWQKVGTVDGFPSNHVILPDDFHIVTHAMPDGFSIIDGVTGSTTDLVDFSSEVITDVNGDVLAFAPNNPAGAILIGGNICVATSNMDHMDMDPVLSTFHPGTAICFIYNGNGTVAHESSMALYTSGVNPTGMILLDDGRFAVLSSGSYSPDDNNGAVVDVFTWPAVDASATWLLTPNGQKVTAQISPDLATISGGILVGVQKPYASVMGVDLDAGNISSTFETPEVKNFISATQVYGKTAALTDFGIFGESGRIVFLQTDDGGWEGTLETPLDGSAGPSVLIGGDLLQTTTSPDMSGGSIWKIDMKNL